MTKNIEVELRSRFSKEKYEELLSFFEKNAKHLGDDDKEIWFYVMEDKLLRVTHNISKGNGKITLKLNKIGFGSSFEEIEFYIDEKDVKKAVNVFNILGHEDLHEPQVLRKNFEYKGVEFALKYSESWGYHMELEILVSDKSEEVEADKRIREAAKELGVDIMSDKELFEFTQDLERKYDLNVRKKVK